MAESITCPRCGMTSHNENDVREGYCGNCHDWTRPQSWYGTLQMPLEPVSTGEGFGIPILEGGAGQ